MPRKFKEARQINKLKIIEAAAKLGISQPTLSAWGGGNGNPLAWITWRIWRIYMASSSFVSSECVPVCTIFPASTTKI